MGLTAIKVTVQHEECGRAAAASVLNQKGLGGTFSPFECEPVGFGCLAVLCLERGI